MEKKINIEEKIKPIGLSEKNMDSIIKTNYGAFRIKPCFGFMKISDPQKIKSGSFLTPDEMEEVKKNYIAEIRKMVSLADTCMTCYLFDKCIRVSMLNLIKDGK